VEFLLERGNPGEIYNIGGGNEKTNLEITAKILDLLSRDDTMIEYVTDRPGHDLRYSLDCQRIHHLGWRPQVNFEDGLLKTVEWYRSNEWWWRPLVRRRVNQEQTLEASRKMDRIRSKTREGAYHAAKSVREDRDRM